MTGKDLGEGFGALGHRAHFQAGEGLALLAQNTDDVAGRAGAQANQHQFDGAARRLLAAGVHNQRVTATRLAEETVVVESDMCLALSIMDVSSDCGSWLLVPHSAQRIPRSQLLSGGVLLFGTAPPVAAPFPCLS